MMFFPQLKWTGFRGKITPHPEPSWSDRYHERTVPSRREGVRDVRAALLAVGVNTQREE